MKRLLVVSVLLTLVVINVNGKEILPLNGFWNFSLESADTTGFEQPTFDDSGWGKIMVPSHWELSGYGTPSYSTPSDEVGLYRFCFIVPEDWRGSHRVFIKFDSVYNGCEVFLNGKKLARHEGAHTPFTVELTDTLKIYGKNLLAVRVEKKIPHYRIDNGDFWQLGGIYRKCQLFALPIEAAITDFLWQTPAGEDGLLPSGKVVIHTTTEIREPGKNLRLVVSLLKNDRRLATKRIPLPGEVGSFSIPLELNNRKPQHWTAETPNLYQLRLQIYKGTTILQEENCNLGFRVCTTRDGVLLLNGRPLTIRGTGQLDIWPDVGRSVTDEMYEIDIRMMKEANINTLRPGWAGIGEHMLELCDKRGMYLIGECPFSNVSQELLDDTSIVPEFLSRVKDAVHYLKNHPSVIMYSVGNENSYRAIHPPLLQWIRKEDSSRPILLPYGGWASYPDADIISWHYPGESALERIEEMKAKADKRPIIFTEYCHGLWGGGGGLEQLWNYFSSTPLIAGGCQFEWCDQGLRYNTDGGKVLDSTGGRGTDGMVSADREPQEEYFQLKQTYCPVQIIPNQLHYPNIKIPEKVEVPFRNLHDFINLSNFTVLARWLAPDDGGEIEIFRTKMPRVNPGKEGKIAIARSRNDYSHLNFLHISIINPEGITIGEKTLRITGGIKPDKKRTQTPKLKVAGAVWTLSAGDNAWMLDAAKGQLLEVKSKGKRTKITGPGLDAWSHPFQHLAYRNVPDTLLDDVTPSKPKVTLLQKIETADEVGGVWQVEYFTDANIWPAFLSFRSGYRMTVDREGQLTVHWAHTYAGRSGKRIRRWGVSIGVDDMDELFYHGRGPGRSFPDKWAHQLIGCYNLGFSPEVAMQNRQETTCALLKMKGGGGISITPNLPIGMRAVVDASNHAEIGLAPLVQGIGNKFKHPMSSFAFDQSLVHTATGALLLGTNGQYWKQPPPAPWPEFDDGDKWSVAEEMKRGSNPLLPDSDGDGLIDSEDPNPVDADIPARRAFSITKLGKLKPPAKYDRKWAWLEAEGAHHMRGAEKDINKMEQTSGGVCLGGFRNSGEGALYAFSLPYTQEESSIALRYSRVARTPAKINISLFNQDKKYEKTLLLPPTRGWGYNANEWKMAKVKLGEVQSGTVVVELTAASSSSETDNINLDGFYLLEKGTKPPLKIGGIKVNRATYEAHVPIKAITSGPKSHWYGYYDKHLFDPTGRYVLSMEVGFGDRSPTQNDVISLGMTDLHDNNKWIKIGESRAWGWQQGCMLQWIPGSNSEVVYNDRRDGRFVAVVCNVFTRETRVLPRPIYTLSPNGRDALSVNFSRIDDTRPGYGYEGVTDPLGDDLHPKEDGIFSMDLKTGKSDLIITLDQIVTTGREQKENEGKHWFNHLLWSPDGSRFIFLHRWYKQAPKKKGWLTRMFTANAKGGDIHCVDPWGRTSHFYWRNPKQIIMWTWTPKTGSHYLLFDDKSDKIEIIGDGILTQNGHMTYSPNGKWLLTDTYPSRKDRMQTLMLYRPRDKKMVVLGKFLEPRKFGGEWRCDLHPSWNRDGTKVVMESTHSGQRQLYLLDVSKVVAE
jgi:Glycosyl hydrolases family 2, TIM barrel domain/Glycosyl hydrolases family 2, sugar binding domain/Glycosyl hydrolases family 2/Beta galactosidase small chain